MWQGSTRKARKSNVPMNKMSGDTRLQVNESKARQALASTAVKNNTDNYRCREYLIILLFYPTFSLSFYSSFENEVSYVLK